MIKKILTVGLLGVLGLLGACNQAEQTPVATTQPYNANTMNEEAMPFDENDPLVKDNFDLQRAGELLRKSNTPAEFESYLNEEDGINNLDLNGDGYADYISVEEFDDRPDGQRGLSLFARYGPDLIQNIASIFLYRDEPRYPGARFLIRGDDVLYGDNYYYETNWLDQTLGIASLLFGDHDRYVSPYYYDHYPPDYAVYDVVETPYYRTRIQDMWPQPVFVYTAAAPAYYERIRVRSPYDDRYISQIYARPMKPKKDQIDFRRGKPGKPIQARRNRDDAPGRSENAPGQRGVPPGQNKDVIDGPASERGKGNPGGPPKGERPANPGNPNKPDNPNAGQNRGQGQNKGKGQGENKGGGQGQNKGGGQGKGKGKP